MIPTLDPRLTKALNTDEYSSFCDFVPPPQTKQKNRFPIVFSLRPALKSRSVQGVRAGSCLGYRGLSLRSWCLNRSLHRCVRPLPGFSPVFACGWRRGEPAGPGSRNGHAFHRMGPGWRRREWNSNICLCQKKTSVRFNINLVIFWASHRNVNACCSHTHCIHSGTLTPSSLIRASNLLSNYTMKEAPLFAAYTVSS